MNYINLVKKIFYKRKSLPVYLIYFITNKCVSKCDHCFYWERINRKCSELNLEELNKISFSLKSLSHINITGGEPFLRNDLPEVISLFYNNSKVRSFIITTNGYNPDRILNMVYKILEENRKINLYLSISLDYYSDDYDKMRNLPGLFNNTTKTIMALKKINSERLIVGVNLLYMKKNEGKITKIYTFIRDEIDPDLIDLILIRGTPENIEEKKISSKIHEELVNVWIEDIRDHKFRGYNYYNLGSLIAARDIISKKRILNESMENGKYLKCVAGILGGVIREDGQVFPCEMLNEDFGNIRDYEYDFKQVWFSEKADSIRKRIKKDKCKCTHECFQNLNVLFNIKMLPQLLKECFTNRK